MSDSPAGYSTAPDRPADAGGVRNDILLALVVVTALSFDFTNGFHDTGNAMATSIATKALSPRIAVALSGVLNLVGAFLSLSVAATIASGLVNTGLVTLTVVFAGLAGGITWNLLTWLLGIPSSSSHALIGGVIGSTIAAAGGHAVQWHDLFAKVIIRPATFHRTSAAVVGAGAYFLAHAMGGNAGVTVDLVLLLAVAGTIYLRSRQSRVGHDNVNSGWTGSAAPVPEATSPEPAAA